MLKNTNNIQISYPSGEKVMERIPKGGSFSPRETILLQWQNEIIFKHQYFQWIFVWSLLFFGELCLIDLICGVGTGLNPQFCSILLEIISDYFKEHEWYAYEEAIWICVCLLLLFGELCLIDIICGVGTGLNTWFCSILYEIMSDYFTEHE